MPEFRDAANRTWRVDSKRLIPFASRQKSHAGPRRSGKGRRGVCRGSHRAAPQWGNRSAAPTRVNPTRSHWFRLVGRKMTWQTKKKTAAPVSKRASNNWRGGTEPK